MNLTARSVSVAHWSIPKTTVRNYARRKRREARLGLSGLPRVVFIAALAGDAYDPRYRMSPHSIFRAILRLWGFRGHAGDIFTSASPQSLRFQSSRTAVSYRHHALKVPKEVNIDFLRRFFSLR
jgi:hypothetical protein